MSPLSADIQDISCRRISGSTKLLCMGSYGQGPPRQFKADKFNLEDVDDRITEIFVVFDGPVKCTSDETTLTCTR